MESFPSLNKTFSRLTLLLTMFHRQNHQISSLTFQISIPTKMPKKRQLSKSNRLLPLNSKKIILLLTSASCYPTNPSKLRSSPDSTKKGGTNRKSKTTSRKSDLQSSCWPKEARRGWIRTSKTTSSKGSKSSSNARRRRSWSGRGFRSSSKNCK